jgi:hypothetical protein
LSAICAGLVATLLWFIATLIQTLSFGIGRWTLDVRRFPPLL